MNSQLTPLLEKRRSIYALSKNVTTSKKELTQLVKDTIKHSPSAFNSQSTRAAILFDQSHDKLWDIVWDHLKSVNANAPQEALEATKAKIDGFKAAYGTILFFEDQDTVHQLEEQFPLYADNFQPWSEQANGAASMNVWTSLAEQGIGASLQHYNPLIDEDVQKAFNLPKSWRLRSQMPFGAIEAAAGDKSFLPIDNRVLSFD